MSEHSPIRRQAIVDAATAAGMHYPEDALRFIPASETMPPAEAVEALRSLHPVFFKPKQARDMSDKEAEAALLALGVRPRRHRG